MSSFYDTSRVVQREPTGRLFLSGRRKPAGFLGQGSNLHVSQHVSLVSDFGLLDDVAGGAVIERRRAVISSSVNCQIGPAAAGFWFSAQNDPGSRRRPSAVAGRVVMDAF